MLSFPFFRRRSQRLAAARRAVQGTGSEPKTRLERDFAALWSDLDGLRETPFPARERARERWRSALRGRAPRMVFAGAALAAAALVATVLGVSLYRDHVPREDVGYATAARQQQQVTLPDGTTVRLNVGSRVHVRYFHGRREVQLHAGEAFFSVVRDDARPLTVVAGDVYVRVVGTQFNVRLHGDAVDVAVRTGQVAVYTAGDRTQALATLSAGQAARLSGAGLTGAVAHIAPDAAGAWTEGWVKVDRAPLADLIDELKRYREASVDLAPEAARLRVSGAFRTDDLDGVMQMLPRVLPVAVASRPGGYAVRIVQSGAPAAQPPRYLETPAPR